MRQAHTKGGDIGMEPSGLFGTPSVDPAAGSGGTSVEQRLDGLLEAAKQAGQLAGKLRTALSRVEENAKTGGIIAMGRIDRVSESVAELSSLVSQVASQAADLQSGGPSAFDYMSELGPELVKRGVKVTKGPEPYWLVYPAWFQIGHDSKGALEVTLNGDRLEFIRPSAVAAKIAEVVNEKFNAEQFRETLVSVRDVIRRAGAHGATLGLDDVYEVLNMGSGRRSARSGDLSKAAFYYSVHRLAEGIGQKSGLSLRFPPANYKAEIFFTKEGESRKYLTVDFSGTS